jgi:hypothetical protein
MPFDDDDFSDDAFDGGEPKEPVWKNHPLYIKAMDIAGTVDALSDTLSEDEREMYLSTLRESSYILGAKIAGAMGSENWIISMQNAAIIRYHAAYLLISNHNLKEFTKADKKYIKVLRSEVEEFRELFRDWVKTFDDIPREEDEFEDEWGLFIRK